ncbi:T9SS type A sorting domain-containing protein [bacterium]|nr:T9SS type A sorting domain-containing protein [bacterium]
MKTHLYVLALLFCLVLSTPHTSIAQSRLTTERARVGASVPRMDERPSRASSSGFDVSYYHLTLNLNGLQNPILVGRNRITGKAVVDLDTLLFDLSSNMVVDFVSLTTGKVLSSSHTQDQILVVLENTLTAGSVLDLDIVYHGNPTKTGFGAFTSLQNEPGRPNTIWTLSEPYGAKEWWPVDDELTDKADSVRLTVKVPSPMTVASNGVLLSEFLHNDGSKTFDWMHRYPIAPYLVSLAIGEYDVFHQLYSRPPALAAEFGPASFPIDHFAYKNSNAFQGVSTTSGWHLALEMMSVFEDWMGPYPFAKEKYGHAHVTFSGGMEHQTISSMGNIGAELIAHELAHQWFGDKLTPAFWKDLWLNEGFATMSEFLIYESDPKYDFLKGFLGDIYYDRARAASGTLVLQDTTSINEMFAFSRVYAKGYMVLRMIRGVVGDDVFKQILRTYTSLPAGAYGSVTTQDFQRVVEEVSGRSFETFFNQWVYSGTGYPTYAISSEPIPTPISPFKTRLTITQLQESNESNVEAFDLPLWIHIETSNRTVLVRLENGQRVQTYDIDLDAALVSATVDPDRWVLRGESPISSGFASTSEVPNGLEVSIYPNPANRSFHVQVEVSGGNEPVELRLFDQLGRLVFEERRAVSAPEQLVFLVEPQIQMRSLAPGVYVAQVQHGSTFSSHSVVFIR